MRFFKVHGLERSFTNYWESIILQNFDNYTSDSKVNDGFDPETEENLGPWKHWYPGTNLLQEINDYRGHVYSNALEQGMLDFYFCIKNPYGWLVSYIKGHEKGHLLGEHYRFNDDNFLSKFSDLMDRARSKNHYSLLRDNDEFIEALCKKYNHVNKQYHKFAQHHDGISVFLKYEDVIKNLKSQLEHVKNHMELTRSQNEWQDIDQEVMTDRHRSQKKYDTTYWEKARYFADLPEKHLEIANDVIDFDFFKEHFGYRKRKRVPNVKKKDDGLNIVAYGDWNPYTGFGRVMDGIFTNLPSNWNIKVMGINFKPYQPIHNTPENIDVYRVEEEGNPYGFQTFLRFLQGTDFPYDVVFSLQDGFIFSKPIQLEEEKRTFATVISNITHTNGAKAVGYTPVDAPKPYAEWYEPFLRAFDIPVTYTDWAKDAIFSEVNDEDLEEKMEVIYHGTNPDTFFPLSEEATKKNRNNFGFSDDDFIFLVVAANQRRKDYPRAVMESFARLAEKRKDCRLIMKTQIDAGGNSGWHLGKIKDQITDLHGLDDDRIQFFGHEGYVKAQDLNAIYNMADCVFLPSLEGWGLPITEAYCSKTPTIVGDHGALGEIGKDGRSIMIDVPQNLEHRTWYTRDNNIYRSVIDSDDFVEKAEALMDGEIDTEKMCDRAYEWAMEYTWEKISKKWEKAFRRVG